MASTQSTKVTIVNGPEGKLFQINDGPQLMWKELLPEERTVVLHAVSFDDDPKVFDWLPPAGWAHGGAHAGAKTRPVRNANNVRIQ